MDPDDPGNESDGREGDPGQEDSQLMEELAPG
jgi:hypothetical protein